MNFDCLILDICIRIKQNVSKINETQVKRTDTHVLSLVASNIHFVCSQILLPASYVNKKSKGAKLFSAGITQSF